MRKREDVLLRKTFIKVKGGTFLISIFIMYLQELKFRIKNMRMFIYLFAAFIISYGNMNAQSIPTKSVDISVSNLNILDSLFLKSLDSLIFNSICPEIKEAKAKIFNVHCKIKDKQNKVYKLTFFLDNIIQIYPQEKFRGCFEYNGYLFLWFYDIPEKLLSVSDKKRKLTYMEGIYVTSDFAEFMFNYSANKLELTGICCY